MFRDKVAVLGVTGSIAAYKVPDLATKLTKDGIEVNVVMTKSATEFITTLTFRSLTNRPVITEMFDSLSEFGVEHVALAERADVVVIAPATANTMAKLATGIADNMLSCIVLATKAQVILAPAMNLRMWENPITQENLRRLESRGFIIVGPTCGRLASGALGKGRFAELSEILGTIYYVLGKEGDFSGKKVLISAGGTQEPIDPVRYISNHSSGKMGYALAEAARNRGATVTLVTTFTNLAPPAQIEMVYANTALEMREAILNRVPEVDVLIMAAAISDYRLKTMSQSKVKREKFETLTLELIKNPDILSEARGNFVKVGFAAESEELLKNAREKLEKKGLDLIVANDITSPNSGFGVDTNKITLISRTGEVEDFPLMLKSELANKILDKVGELL